MWKEGAVVEAKFLLQSSPGPSKFFIERALVDLSRTRLVRFELSPTMCSHCLGSDWLLVDFSSCMQGLSEG